jgi:N-methylhydantoinase B
MSPRRTAPPALRLEIDQHLLSSIPEQMGAALLRSSFSPNIKERRDFSCALFDARGRMVTQAAHLPIHLGAAPLSVQAAIAAAPMRRGDAVLLNDPYGVHGGGTHLPDLTLVSPVHLDRRSDRPAFYVANRAHHADVGGASPGSMAPAADIHGEGLRVPPTTLVRSGRVVPEVMALVLANMRVPAEREGDLLAQWAANRTGDRRLSDLAREIPPAALVRRAAELQAWGARHARALVRELERRTRGRALACSDVLELPGGRSARVAVSLRARRGRLDVDLTGCADQVRGSVNASRAVAVAAVLYVLRLLLPRDAPTNDGLLAPVRILTRPGSIVDAAYPACVAAGNVETSQRLVDVLLGALAGALPERIPAASSGTMSNLTLGGARPRDGSPFAYYETLAGGAGASPSAAGAHALHTHMTNTRNTPVEALELDFPTRVRSLAIRRGSGGRGRRRGGEGLEKRIECLAPLRVAWVADRQRRGPWGLAGGARGARGGAWSRERGARERRALEPAEERELGTGAELGVRTPGGGGSGRARGIRL